MTDRRKKNTQNLRYYVNETESRMKIPTYTARDWCFFFVCRAIYGKSLTPNCYLLNKKRRRYKTEFIQKYQSLVNSGFLGWFSVHPIVNNFEWNFFIEITRIYWHFSTFFFINFCLCFQFDIMNVMPPTYGG